MCTGTASFFAMKCSNVEPKPEPECPFVPSFQPHALKQTSEP